MSTSSIAGLSTGASGVGSGNLLQITGLASNLDTTSIINALMALDRAPLTNLTNQQTALQTRNTQLTSIQTALQTVAMNAQSLGSPGLFANIADGDEQRSDPRLGGDEPRALASAAIRLRSRNLRTRVTGRSRSPARPRMRRSRSTAGDLSPSRPARR